MKIALISCSKSKQNYPCKANEMYSKSTLFRCSYEYAKIYADKVYILSAKYGLLQENQLIEPYDLTLKSMSVQQNKLWSELVIKQMESVFDIENNEFIILAGKEYYNNLSNYIKHYELPLGNLMFGERISFLQNYLKNSTSIINCETTPKSYAISDPTNSLCMQLHIMFNNLKTYDYGQINNIPFDNGIYIMFEKGELYSEFNRIVRVGTHNAQGRLKKRLKDHFTRKNKDGSIFRKNIGKALLNKRNDDYLSIWSINTSKPENKRFKNREVQKSIENEVSEYLQNNITFAVFRVDNDNIRLRLEKAIIATLNKEKTFYPSSNWLGGFSPEIEIREGGLWLKDGLNHTILNEIELECIKTCIYNNVSSSNLENINNFKTITEKPKSKEVINNVRIGIEGIKEFIVNKLENQKNKGNHECILISGDIHKQMKLSNKMPSVCNAMYRVMKPNDEILMTTKSGKSSTITIKYYL